MRRALILLILANSSFAHAADVIAHRGFGCGIQDNSIEGIHLAWAAGVDAIELDVRVSVDGLAYLFHDDEIGDTAVSDLSFDEVSAITSRDLVVLTDLASTPNAADYYLLDLKSVDTASIGTVLAAVRASGADISSVSYQSDDLAVLREIRRQLPHAKLYFLSRLEWRVPYVIPASAASLAKSLRNSGVDGVSIKGRSFVGQDFVNILKSAGLTVNVWTINDPERIDHYKRAGVDAIITDEVAHALDNSATCDS